MNLIDKLFTLSKIIIILCGSYLFVKEKLKKLEKKKQRKIELEKIAHIRPLIRMWINYYKNEAIRCYENERIIKITVDYFEKQYKICYDLRDFEKLQKEIEDEIEKVRMFESFHKQQKEDYETYEEKRSNSSSLGKYFTILGINYTDDKDIIKKTYKSLLRKYHPDLHPNDNEALKKTQDINEAYSQLKVAFDIK